MSFRIIEIVLTGGPCSGKSSLLERAKRDVRTNGWVVYPIEEPATKLIKEGLPIKRALEKGDLSLIYECELKIARWCMRMRAETRRRAKVNGQQAVILWDRAIPDNYAYMPAGEVGEGMYLRILGDISHRPEEILNMYDAVIKLTTAADGAPQFYTLRNNMARTEDLKEALRLDRRIEIAYAAHRNLFIVDNSTDFERKMQRALDMIHSVLHWK